MTGLLVWGAYLGAGWVVARQLRALFRPDEDEYVPRVLGDGSLVENRADLPWWQAPKPPQAHTCEPWSKLRRADGESIERCPCGGVKYAGTGWLEQNARRTA